MGLDVSLLRAPVPAKKWIAKEPKRDDCYEQLREVSQKSRKFPEHLFRIDYWRSSYNDGGINNVLRNAIGETLYSIAGVDHDGPYYNVPDWEATMGRAARALDLLRMHSERAGGFGVVRAKAFGEVKEPDVLDTFLRMREQWSKEDEGQRFQSFSNRDGVFYLGEPLQVHAVFVDKTAFLGPDVFLVVKGKEGTLHKSYFESLEIVQETCAWVLEQPDKDHYLQAWSG